MIVLLFLLAVGIFIVMLADMGRAANDAKNLLKPTCPPHKWLYGPDGRMYCQSCGDKPFQGGLQ